MRKQCDDNMSPNKPQSGLKLLPLKSIVFIFCVLSFLVIVNVFLSSSSRFSFIVDVSMRAKSDFTRVLKKIIDVVGIEALTGRINGTLTLAPVDKTVDDQIKLILDNGIKVERISVDNQTGFTGNATSVKVQYDVWGNPLVPGNTEQARRDSCVSCFKHDFEYVIDNKDICKLYQGQTEIELLIIIMTVHKNQVQRNVIRETWLTYSKTNRGNVRYAFLLGQVKDVKQRDDVLKESKKFGDIIKENFVDVYSNLTYKTIMGFKWAATKCSVAKFVMKTDDDMYVNVPNVLKIVRNNGTLLQNRVAGSCAMSAGPIRSLKSKWYASIKSYPSNRYPGFCSGTGYVTSTNVARKIYEISPYVPFFHLEDVYTALCVKRLGYHLQPLPGFHPGRPKLDPCFFNGDKMVTAHYMTPATIKQMWKNDCKPGDKNLQNK